MRKRTSLLEILGGVEIPQLVAPHGGAPRLTMADVDVLISRRDANLDAEEEVVEAAAIEEE